MQALGYSRYICLYTWVSASKQAADLSNSTCLHAPFPHVLGPSCSVFTPQHVLPCPLRLLTARTAALKDFSRSCLSLTLALRRSSASFLEDACVRGEGRGGGGAVHRWSCVSRDMHMSRNVRVTC